MEHDIPTLVLHWNYQGFTEFPLQKLEGGETEVTDIYLKENLISRIPTDIGKLVHLESLYLSGNDITELPREISKLQYLKCLDLSGNRLKRIPEEIGDIQRLKFLILDENELVDLPLRLAELRALRYLSVCDNKLSWLPQRPVYNYYHCEFRFWRNPTLKTIPYSLWYHMFKGQQTRSLNIGSLTIPRYQHIADDGRCRIKLSQDSREWEVNVELPTPHSTIFERSLCSPPSLYEICRRTLYQVLTNAAKKLSTELFSIYADDNTDCYRFNNVGNLRDHLQFMNIDNADDYDFNGNNLENISPNQYNCLVQMKRKKDHYVPKDIVEDHFSFLPNFMKENLRNGPVSKCENVCCKIPVFDYAFYEFCLGNIILIDNTQEVILSATFCSKTCAEAWRSGRTNLLSWTPLGNG